MAMNSIQAFYAFCDSVHREFFSALLFDWQEAGQAVDVVGAGHEVEGAVLLQVRCVGRAGTDDAGKTMLPCLFALHAGGGIEPARITINMHDWRELFGSEVRDEFIERLQAMQGLICRRRDADFSIMEPAHLSGPSQQLLRDAIVGFGRQSRELLGR